MRSRVPLVRVRFRVSPFLAGTENSSPLASMANRLPEGDREPPEMNGVRLRIPGRALRFSE